MASKPPTAIVSGMVSGNPGQGGAAWAVLQYLLGLRDLGWDAYLIEPLKQADVRPHGAPLEESLNASYFRAIASRFGLEGRSSLILEGSTETVGMPYSELREVARRAEALWNVSGMLDRSDLLESIPTRVYLDLDPAFNQLWHATQGIDMRFSAHTHFVTVGNGLGRPECSLPTCGLEWVSTLQPVFLPDWPRAGEIAFDGLTTVANWRGYGSIDHGGVFYGQKAHALRELADIPTRTSEKFLLALSIHPDESRDLELLQSHRWELADPSKLAETPDKYAEFIRGSKAEFGVAKAGYVVSRCGWFSDRSACYLASGRPVIAQETGFSRFLPCGDGLFAFRTVDDVLAAIDHLNGDYERSSDAARALAEDLFDSAKVLPRLLTAVGLQ